MPTRMTTAERDTRFLKTMESSGISKEEAMGNLKKIKGVVETYKKNNNIETPFYDKSYGQLASELPGNLVQDVRETIGGMGNFLWTGVSAFGNQLKGWANPAEHIKSNLLGPVEQLGGVSGTLSKTGKVLAGGGGKILESLKEEYIAPEGMNQIDYLAKRGLAKPFSTALDVSGGASLVKAPLKAATKISKVSTLEKGVAAVDRISKMTDPAIILGKGWNAKKVANLRRGINNFMTEKVPSKLINSMIKPLEAQFRFGRDPGLMVAKEGLKAPTRKGLLNKINDRREFYGQQIGEKVKNAEGTINIQPLLNSLDNKIKRAVSAGEESLYTRLQKVRDGLTHEFTLQKGKVVPKKEKSLNLTVEEAHNLKTQIGEDTKWTGQPFDEDINQARVELYRQLNDMVEKKVPGIKNVQDKYANLLDAHKALDRRMNIEARNNIVDLPGALIGFGGFTMGSFGGAVMGFAIRKFMGSTVAKSYTASAVAALRKAGVPKIVAEKLAKKDFLEKVRQGYFAAEIASNLED